MRLPLLALPLAASLALSLALAPPPALAEPPVLDLPVACVLGETCHLQQFPDRDPGPGARDFTCGPLSYDGHKGTDVALASEADMRAGVAVLAAAGGVVKAVRDGMADAAQGDVGAPDITDRECGNGVVIDHGAGWETQYCHMARGSLRVARGEPVG